MLRQGLGWGEGRWMKIFQNIFIELYVSYIF
jgi:hypothetical protein